MVRVCIMSADENVTVMQYSARRHGNAKSSVNPTLVEIRRPCVESH